uniref:alpha-1,3-mannosyl-glycoprotein 2-beta-N-acetylglucosaminyltransferase n=1 Tax=Spongospora subterranea TaxID=70186 RepID=A0A0H5QPX8_9EUKA|eukprot:CRZ04098.1 hypothetical protein [Spongospora subterranea]
MLHRRDNRSHRPTGTSRLFESSRTGRYVHKLKPAIGFLLFLICGVILLSVLTMKSSPEEFRPQPIQSVSPVIISPSKIRGPAVSPVIAVDAIGPPANSVDIAVVLVCFNRPDYVRRTVDSLLTIWPENSSIGPARLHLTISQDGDFKPVTSVIELLLKDHDNVQHLRFNYDHDKWQASYPEQFLQDFSVYYRISAHYQFILNDFLFNKNNSHLLFIEDDMEFAPDFLSYFAALANPLIRWQSSTYCVSAWNDNGRENLVSNPNVLYRTDVFPGLGWMLTRKMAHELYEKWPAGFWDDWLRAPEQKRGRSCVYPEMNRVKTFGSEGSSHGEFYAQYLERIQLNTVNIDWLKQSSAIPETLDPIKFEARLYDDLKKATTITRSEMKGLLDGSKPLGLCVSGCVSIKF